MTKITIIQVGKAKEQFCKTGIEMFQKRTTNFEVIELKDSTKQKEGTAITQKLSKSSYDIVIALDERGEQFSSREFAQFLKSNQDKSLAFVIGGPDGLSEEVTQQATQIMGLSRMTLTHEMAQLLFFEQLYRAQSINDGKNYHRD